MARRAARRQPFITLMRNARRGEGLGSRLAVTTPSLLSRWVQINARRRIAADASFELLSADADLCAHEGLKASHMLFALSARGPWLGRLECHRRRRHRSAASALWLFRRGFGFDDL